MTLGDLETKEGDVSLKIEIMRNKCWKNMKFIKTIIRTKIKYCKDSNKIFKVMFQVLKWNITFTKYNIPRNEGPLRNQIIKCRLFDANEIFYEYTQFSHRINFFLL